MRRRTLHCDRDRRWENCSEAGTTYCVELLRPRRGDSSKLLHLNIFSSTSNSSNKLCKVGEWNTFELWGIKWGEQERFIQISATVQSICCSLYQHTCGDFLKIICRSPHHSLGKRHLVKVVLLMSSQIKSFERVKSTACRQRKEIRRLSESVFDNHLVVVMASRPRSTRAKNNTLTHALH